MSFLIISISGILFSFITFIIFCILHCSTPLDRLTDDTQQELFLKHYTIP